MHTASNHQRSRSMRDTNNSPRLNNSSNNMVRRPRRKTRMPDRSRLRRTTSTNNSSHRATGTVRLVPSLRPSSTRCLPNSSSSSRCEAARRALSRALPRRMPLQRGSGPPQASRSCSVSGLRSVWVSQLIADVKALYDYQAQSAAEFDFQAGDIIAVTNTPEDGWWSGELLDEARRQAGRTDFPSNL